MNEPRLSIPEIAKKLNVTERTVHNWINDGKLAAHEEHRGHQRRRYVDQGVFDAFVATLPDSSAVNQQ